MNRSTEIKTSILAALAGALPFAFGPGKLPKIRRGNKYATGTTSTHGMVQPAPRRFGKSNQRGDTVQAIGIDEYERRLNAAPRTKDGNRLGLRKRKQFAGLR